MSGYFITEANNNIINSKLVLLRVIYIYIYMCVCVSHCDLFQLTVFLLKISFHVCFVLLSFLEFNIDPEKDVFGL